MSELWPFRPQLGMVERLAWLSDVMSVYTGEQRLKLRAVPRQNFEMSHRLDDRGLILAKQFAQRNRAVAVLVPVWLEQVQLGAVADTDTGLSFDTTAGDFRAGGQIVLWKDAETYALATVDTLSTGGMTLTAAVGTAFANPLVMPVRTALANNGYTIGRNTTYSDASAKFLVADNVGLTPTSDLYPQYNSMDVVTERPALVTNVSESIVQSADYVDNGFGPVALEVARDYADYGQTVSFLDRLGSPFWARRTWLHSLNGKQKPFFLPSFNNDLVPTGTIGALDTTITVKSIGVPADYTGRKVMIETVAGTRYFRSIDSATAGSGTGSIVIDSALGASLDPVDIKAFSFMSQVRLNADQVTMTWRDYDVVSTAVPVIEVPA